MGANTLIKYCGEKSEHCKFKGIISVNNPWDVNTAMNLMRGKVVEPYLVFSLIDAFLSRKTQTWTKKNENLPHDYKFGLTEDEYKIFKSFRTEFGVDYDKLF